MVQHRHLRSTMTRIWKIHAYRAGGNNGLSTADYPFADTRTTRTSSQPSLACGLRLYDSPIPCEVRLSANRLYSVRVLAEGDVCYLQTLYAAMVPCRLVSNTLDFYAKIFAPRWAGHNLINSPATPPRLNRRPETDHLPVPPATSPKGVPLPLAGRAAADVAAAPWVEEGDDAARDGLGDAGVEGV